MPLSVASKSHGSKLYFPRWTYPASACGVFSMLIKYSQFCRAFYLIWKLCLHFLRFFLALCFSAQALPWIIYQLNSSSIFFQFSLMTSCNRQNPWTIQLPNPVHLPDVNNSQFMLLRRIVVTLDLSSIILLKISSMIHCQPVLSFCLDVAHFKVLSLFLLFLFAFMFLLHEV